MEVEYSSYAQDIDCYYVLLDQVAESAARGRHCERTLLSLDETADGLDEAELLTQRL